MGMMLASRGMTPKDLVGEELLMGVLDAVAKGKCKLEDQELTAAFEQLKVRMLKRFDEAAKANADEAAKFAEDNKKKDGVVTLPSGLQYKVLKSGTGAQPTLTSLVKVHYEGKLLDGTVFDSSIQRNMPAEFQLTNIIAGWREGLQKMKVGDKWQLFVPPDLAYGPEGRPPAIMPNSLLVFEVELLAVKESK